MQSNIKSAPISSNIFILLQIPAYRELLLSNALWWQTLAMWTTTAGWLMLDLTDLAWMVTLLSFWRRTAQLSLGFFAGPVGDRLGRRRAILMTQTLNLVVCTLLLLLFWGGRLTPWLLAGAAFLIGSAWTLDAPARTALTPDLVGAERITEAMILENFLQSLMSSMGPFVAGWLLALTGPIGCFVVLVGMTGANVLLLQRLVHHQVERTTQIHSTSIWKAIGEGIEYVRSKPVILAVTLTSIVLNTLIFPSLSLLPVFARDVLAQGPVGLGLLTTGYSLGIFAGLYLVSRLRHRFAIGQLFMMGALVECVTLVIFAGSRTYLLSWLMLFGAGLGQASFNTLRSAILLSTATDAMRGRAISTVGLTQGAGLPGELQSGFLADTIGAPATVGLQAGIAAIGSALVAWALPAVYRR
ncbi:MAG: MFS transporter [Caldilineaceae bacterium]